MKRHLAFASGAEFVKWEETMKADPAWKCLKPNMGTSSGSLHLSLLLYMFEISLMKLKGGKHYPELRKYICYLPAPREQYTE